MRVFRHNQRRGAALMLALWALFLLSAMVISWTLQINSRLMMSASANRNMEAEALACSGAEVAMYPTIKPDSPALVGGFGGNQGYEVHMTGEGGRINLRNFLAGEKPAAIEVIRKYLEIKGVDLNERDRMIDTLLDWVDPDNLVRLNGAEDEPGYKPANRPLKSIDELKKIKGWEEFTSVNDWDADFTLDSQNAIDILWASRDVLLALPGMTEQLADQIIALRSGPDGIEGTKDDPFKTGPEILAAVGISQAQAPQLFSLLASAPESTWRVISVGKSGDVTRTVRMVIIKQQGAALPQLKSWKEY
jgi:general secretion pathway protein K